MAIRWIDIVEAAKNPRCASRGFSLVELLAAIAIAVVLGAMVFIAAKRASASASVAVSANNIRQLAAGGMSYLADNQNVYWKYQQPAGHGTTWWFGFETRASMARAEGQREFDATQGPLANYIPMGIRPDPGLASAGIAFKPKYRSGYIGIGYNTHLGGGYHGNQPPQHHLRIPEPSKIVVFATCAQINTWLKPASGKNPMLEEFYGLDDGASGYPATVHFRSGGKAMVAFATGNVGFIPMDESTRDHRAPRANIGRFAPQGDRSFLRPGE